MKEAFGKGADRMIPFYHDMGADYPHADEQPWRHKNVCVYQEQPCPEPIDRLVV
jgi:hypothetical protein